MWHLEVGSFNWLRHEDGAIMNGISALQETASPPLFFSESSPENCLSSGDSKKVTGNLICQSLDLGIPSFRNYEK